MALRIVYFQSSSDVKTMIILVGLLVNVVCGAVWLWYVYPITRKGIIIVALLIVIGISWGLVRDYQAETAKAQEEKIKQQVYDAEKRKECEKYDREHPNNDSYVCSLYRGQQASDEFKPVIPKSNEEICKDMNGPHGIYISSDNTCGCESGYYYGVVSKKCIDLIESRNESCEVIYPGTSFLKYDKSQDKNICDCLSGYYWDKDRTACYSLSKFNQWCVESFGRGAYSITENGKRVCDCSSGYSFNTKRSMCVTTASIDAICVKDIGRNSKYTGFVKKR